MVRSIFSLFLGIRCIFLGFIVFFVIFAVTPTIYSNDADQMITSSLGTSATLSLTIINASPAVQTSQIRWIFSNSFSTTPTSNGSNVDITNLQSLNSASHLSFSSDLLSLTISNIVAADNGRYFLVATTVAGSAFSYIDIIVEGKIHP